MSYTNHIYGVHASLAIGLPCVILIALVMLLTGCATRFDTRTWVSDDPADPVKHTRVTHSWWMGLPAIAPMDATFTDGEFQVETKAAQVPTIDVGTLFRRDE